MESNLKEDTMEYIDYPEYADIMELFIETLTGTVFELRVSPFETVISVKAKIQRLEGVLNEVYWDCNFSYALVYAMGKLTAYSVELNNNNKFIVFGLVLVYVDGQIIFHFQQFL